MSQIYFPTQRQIFQPQSQSLSSIFYVLYCAYTIGKIGSMIAVLSVDGFKCPGSLYLYLLLYIATEGYELVFFLMISLHRYCLQTNISSFLIRAGQVSYEWWCIFSFRFVITIAIGLEIYKEPSITQYASGIFSLMLVIAGFLKYVIIVLIGIPYVFFYRRIMDEGNPARFEPVTEHELDQYISPMPKGEVCSICYEETSSNSLCVVLRCKHGFHRHCLKDWVLIKGSCPVCRTSIKED